MKNISKKKILIITGILVLCIVAMFSTYIMFPDIFRPKVSVIKPLSEQIYEAKTIAEDISNKEVRGYSDTVVGFGSYVYYDGRRAPLWWKVLEKDETNHRALLFAEWINERRQFSENPNNATWENSSIRDYLNGDFLFSKFSDTERKLILDTPLINSSNPIYGTNSGPNTVDKVFLLSFDEVQKYFPGSYDNSGSSEKYYMPDLIESNVRTYTHDIINNYPAEYKDDEGYWNDEKRFFLRTAGVPGEVKNLDGKHNKVLEVSNGKINMKGRIACVPEGLFADGSGIRPAIWVKYNPPDVNFNIISESTEELADKKVKEITKTKFVNRGLGAENYSVILDDGSSINVEQLITTDENWMMAKWYDNNMYYRVVLKVTIATDGTVIRYQTPTFFTENVRRIVKENHRS